MNSCRGLTQVVVFMKIALAPTDYGQFEVRLVLYIPGRTADRSTSALGCISKTENTSLSTTINNQHSNQQPPCELQTSMR